MSSLHRAVFYMYGLNALKYRTTLKWAWYFCLNCSEPRLRRIYRLNILFILLSREKKGECLHSQVVILPWTSPCWEVKPRIHNWKKKTLTLPNTKVIHPLPPARLLLPCPTSSEIWEQKKGRFRKTRFNEQVCWHRLTTCCYISMCIRGSWHGKNKLLAPLCGQITLEIKKSGILNYLYFI